ncbi:MAG: 16S rRNA (adenine(1518)-N(6)/adenine(1519)-N(6))-dimethyltransferase RsmA [Elusimicrobiota bacterium]
MRKFSQVFLKNRAIAEKIVKCFETLVASCNKITEIGPGKGILTEFLFKKYGQNYTGIEIDPIMIDILKRKFKGINLINSDFLQIDQNLLSSYFIGNLPYHISTAIIESLISFNNFKLGIFMFQKEVAKKIVSKPKETGYGYISALINLLAHTEYLFEVSRKEFEPVPEVDSAVILIKINNNQITPDEFENYKKFISMAFMHKRKTLINSLHLSLNKDKKTITEKLIAKKLTENTRAEELSPLQLYDISKSFKS